MATLARPTPRRKATRRWTRWTGIALTAVLPDFSELHFTSHEFDECADRFLLSVDYCIGRLN